MDLQGMNNGGKAEDLSLQTFLNASLGYPDPVSLGIFSHFF